MLIVWSEFCFLIVPCSSLCTLQASRHLAEASALWSAQHHYRVSVHWPGLGFPRNRCSTSKFKCQREPRSSDSGKHWVRQNRHHLPACGPQLPRNSDETDRLGQPACLPQTYVFPFKELLASLLWNVFWRIYSLISLYFLICKTWLACEDHLFRAEGKNLILCLYLTHISNSHLSVTEKNLSLRINLWLLSTGRLATLSCGK